MISKREILNVLKELPEQFLAEEIIARIILLDKKGKGLDDVSYEQSKTIEEVEEKYGKIKSLLINVKNSSERKILLAILKSLKMSYTKIDQQLEDGALLKAIEKGKTKGRATKKEQKEFESWIKSV